MTEERPEKDQRPAPRNKLTWKFLLLTPQRKGPGRPVCAMIGIVVAAVLAQLGYLNAEPTMLSGIAFAALGAIAGLVAYGLYDMARKIL